MVKNVPARTVRLKDVAEAAKVDVSTVSRVLQNKGRVGEKTRERVLEVAARLGYQGNPIARALKTSKSATILIVVPQIENPIFAATIIGAETEARKAGYALLVAYDQGGMGSQIIEDISRSSMFAGVIIASFDDDDRLRQTLASTDRPHVVINRHLPGDPNCVAIDTETAAYIGVRHLIGLGHKRIGHLAGRLGRFNGEARRKGWSRALEEAGLDNDDRLVAEARYDPEMVPAAVDRLLAAGVTAIHAATLLTGAAAIAHLHARGLRVPDDISVVTMHDDLMARVVYPPVTTVDLPSSKMGRAAVKRLVSLLEDKGAETDFSDGNQLLPPGALIERGSAAQLS